MKKSILLAFGLIGFMNISAQTYKDITPASFVQGIDNNCSSACGDLNGDGKLDIILTGRENSSGLYKTWIYLNDGNGGFTLSTNSNITMGFKHSDINLGDYDGDGDLDIVLQGWDWDPNAKISTQRAYVYQNDGTGIFTQVASLDGRSNGTIEFGDYDGDGRMDILQTGWKASINSGKTTIYHNDGNNVFTDIGNTSVFSLADGEARFGDYDNDGNLDIIVNGWMQAHIYKGDGKGNFVNQNIALPAYDWSYVSWIDYDKDGFKDILIGGHYSKDGDHYETKILKGNGTNTFTEMNFGLANVQRGPVKLGDCNNDGKLDFFISGWGGPGVEGVFQIYKNDGTNTAFSPIAGINSLISGWADGTMVVADFDGDGNAEVFKCGWEKTKLYSNSDATNIEESDATATKAYIENNILNIQLASQDGVSKIEVYNMQGVLISNFSFSGEEASFDLPDSTNGYYLVHIKNDLINNTKIVVAN